MNIKSEYENVLEKALALESQGKVTAALSALNKAEIEYPSSRFSIKFEISCILFRAGLFDKALESMIQCHQNDFRKDEIETIVMEAYYDPNIDEFKKHYNQNTSFLIDSAGYRKTDFPIFTDLNHRFIPFTEKKYAIFKVSTKEFTGMADFSKKTLNVDLDPRQIYMVKNEYNITNLNALEKLTRQDHTHGFSKTKLPIFLVYDNKNQLFDHFQILNLSPVFQTGRINIFFNPEQAVSHFNSEDGIYPNLFIYMDNNDKYYNIVEEAKSARVKKENINYQNLMQMFNASLGTKQGN